MWRILLVILLLFTVPLAAQTAAKSTELDWLSGEWSGEGQIFGRPCIVGLAVGPASVGPGKVSGRWADSAGSSHALAGRVSSQKLVSIWGSVDTEIGRTSYQQSADGSLDVIDQVLQADGTWRQFARAVYRRATPR